MHHHVLTVVIALGFALSTAACDSDSTNHSTPGDAGPQNTPPPSPPPGAWAPPTGIPNVVFGINETAGVATHTIDNTSPQATDTGNPKGTRARPRLTIPTSFPAGSVVEIHGGPYDIGKATWSSAGTQAGPVFIKGVGRPVLHGTELYVTGTYVVVEGLIFDGLPLRFIAGASSAALRDSEVRNCFSTATAIYGEGVVFYNNHIHHNGDPNSPNEVDWHGIKVISPARVVWIVDNHIHENSGDAVQVGDASSPEPWPQFIFIGRNHLHEDRENAVDVKKARDVIVSRNLAYGYWVRSSSSGEITVVHDNAQRVWIMNNRFSYAHNGVICSGAQGYFVLNNEISHIFHDPDSTSYDPSSLWGAQAIRTYNTTESYHIGNTIWAADSGLSYASGNVKTEVVNNIIGGLNQPSYQIGFGSTTATNASVISNNFFGGAVRYVVSGASYTSHSAFQSAFSGKGIHSLSGEPLLVDSSKVDLHLQTGSPAKDAGVVHPVYEAFKTLYGIDIFKDRDENPREVGPAVDLGAYEVPSTD